MMFRVKYQLLVLLKSKVRNSKVDGKTSQSKVNINLFFCLLLKTRLKLEGGR